jgi:DNA-binding beta-propeller fold protein YncE
MAIFAPRSAAGFQTSLETIEPGEPDMMTRHPTPTELAVLLLASATSTTFCACGSEDDAGSAHAISAAEVTPEALEQRAYIVSKGSDELTIIDLKQLQIVGKVKTNGVGNHMAELNADFTQAFVDSPETNESIVVDTRTQQVVGRIPLAGFPTHISLSKDGKLFGIVEEDDNAVSFVDPDSHEEVKRVTGFQKPHFVRWAPDGMFAYVANINAHFLTKVDVGSLEIVDTIALDGFDPNSLDAMAPEENGFADAQIDAQGILHAADRGMGRVIMYDTKAQKKLPEVQVGPHPWIVYAEHPFAKIPVSIVPNWGDQSVSMISAAASHKVQNVPDASDQDSNGVNYTPLAPNKAFVMNRLRDDITVVDTSTGELTDRIDVGGNTETASTTADGKWIVAAVSSANRVVVIDAVSNKIIKTFDNLGTYPWSVTIPKGQNYCH